MILLNSPILTQIWGSSLSRCGVEAQYDIFCTERSTGRNVFELGPTRRADPNINVAVCSLLATRYDFLQIQLLCFLMVHQYKILD